jgi:hypothetical protein
MTGPVRVALEADVLGQPEITQLVLDLCSWRRPPQLWSGGRAGWHPLPVRITAETGIAALKLKGLGQAPAHGRRASPPGTEAYDRWPGQAPDPHLGIRADGELCLLPGDPAPVGGLLLDGARREHRAAVALRKAGVPVVAPVAVVAYEAMRYPTGTGARQLGVSITGSPVAGTARCSVALASSWLSAPVRSVERAALARRLRLGDEHRDSGRGRLAMLAATYRAFGETLGAFSRAGWYRYSGHPDNIVIDERGQAVLVDLDSCREADPSRPDLHAMQAVRDGMSALYNLACSFFRGAALNDPDDAELLEYEPFSGFLQGWDPTSSAESVAEGRAIARYVVASRLRLRTFADFLSAPTPAGEQLYRYVRHDRDLTFIWLYRIAWRHWARQEAGAALPFGIAELDERLLRFAGRERYERMLDLVRETN